MFRFAKCRFVCLALVAAVAALGRAAAADPVPADDGWRRTASGWERIDQPSPSASEPNEATSRHDTHPAVLALGQLLASLVALSFLPVQRSGGAVPHSRDWPELVAASFRASVFGA
jgi:hypothetical protein